MSVNPPFPIAGALRRATAIVILISLAGCVAPQNAGEVDRLHSAVRAAADGDRTKAARVAAGLGAATAGVSVACTVLNDMAPVSILASLRRFCAARPVEPST
ncbi:MAG: hypothetical protein AAFT19_10695 [Pseudomonadota bacterium]